MKELPEHVARVIERYGRWDTTLVHSFNPVSLYYMRRASPQATVGFIWAQRHPIPLRARWLSPVAEPHWAVPAEDTYNERVLAHFHGQGKPVMAWDVDAGTDLEALGRTGLDAVVTDDPQEACRPETLADTGYRRGIMPSIYMASWPWGVAGG